MQSSVCTKNLSDGSRRKLFCHPPTPPRCCSGRCSPPVRSTCARWMVGRRSPQNPLISRLTLPPETIPSCYRRMRHTEFQPHSGRHPVEPETPQISSPDQPFWSNSLILWAVQRTDLCQSSSTTKRCPAVRQ